MSAIGGKADIYQGMSECPLIAISGHKGTAYKDWCLGKWEGISMHFSFHLHCSLIFFSPFRVLRW